MPDSGKPDKSMTLFPVFVNNIHIIFIRTLQKTLDILALQIVLIQFDGEEIARQQIHPFEINFFQKIILEYLGNTDQQVHIGALPLEYFVNVCPLIMKPGGELGNGKETFDQMPCTQQI